MQDVFKVISVNDPKVFEQALNDAGADGFKIVPLTTVIRIGSYECIMGKTINAERKGLEEQAKRAGIHLVEGEWEVK